MILFHRTESASKILAEGFRNATGTYLTANRYTGVWLANRPLDINEGAVGDDLLVIDIPENEIAVYEWIEEEKPYREWLIPAEVVNLFPIRQVDEDEAWELAADA